NCRQLAFYGLGLGSLLDDVDTLVAVALELVLQQPADRSRRFFDDVMLRSHRARGSPLLCARRGKVLYKPGKLSQWPSEADCRAAYLFLILGELPLFSGARTRIMTPCGKPILYSHGACPLHALAAVTSRPP